MCPVGKFSDFLTVKTKATVCILKKIYCIISETYDITSMYNTLF